MGVYAWSAFGNLLEDGVNSGQFDAIVHMGGQWHFLDFSRCLSVSLTWRASPLPGDHAYNYGDANGTRADMYLQAYQRVLSRMPWVPVVGTKI